jgi:hypothetical protein
VLPGQIEVGEILQLGQVVGIAAIVSVDFDPLDFPGRFLMVRGQWRYVGAGGAGKPSVAEKLAIATACEKFIASVLIPRFLPKILPTKFNYPVAIFGKWHGNKYRLITRYRSDDPASIQPEFEAPFARLEYVSGDRFDLSYHRHTGEWLPLYQAISLSEALDILAQGAHFLPC